MGKVITGATMSLDGFVAGPNMSGFDLLFQWYGNGDVVVESANPTLTSRMTPENARIYRDQMANTGAIVVGRGVFDITNGWDGVHPFGVPIFVVTHRSAREWQEKYPNAPFTFVKEGVAAAIAKAQTVAGKKDVVVAAGSIGSQALEAGLIDEIGIALAPVVLGSGTPFFQQLGHAPYSFPDAQLEQGTGATHIRYTIPKAARKNKQALAREQ